MLDGTIAEFVYHIFTILFFFWLAWVWREGEGKLWFWNMGFKTILVGFGIWGTVLLF